MGLCASQLAVQESNDLKAPPPSDDCKQHICSDSSFSSDDTAAAKAFATASSKPPECTSPPETAAAVNSGGGGVSPTISDEPIARVVEEIIGRPYDAFSNGPPLPPCNDARLRAVRQLGRNHVDGPAVPSVEHIIALLCQVFHVEAALLALFDDNRIFIRNGKGFQRGDFPWRWSFCAWCMAPPEPEVLLIEDAQQDARFKDNEVALSLGVRFYCGSPLVGSSGQRLGTLCFVDNKPRTFPAEQLVILTNLAELVVRELERDAACAAKAKQVSQFMARAMDCFETGVAFVDTAVPGWAALHCSTSFTEATGITMESAHGRTFWELLLPPAGLCSGADGASCWAATCADVAARSGEFALDGVSVADQPERGIFTLRFRPAGRDALDENTQPVGIPSQVPSQPGSGSQYYFVILAQHHSPPASLGTASWASTVSRESSLGLSSIERSSLTSEVQTARLRGQLMPDSVPFDGLELGPLVGKGSYGRVYRGTWHSEPVAVKVCSRSASSDKVKSGSGALKLCSPPWRSIEALASGKWRHPNIVQAFRHCTVLASGCTVLGADEAEAQRRPKAADGSPSNDGGGDGGLTSLPQDEQRSVRNRGDSAKTSVDCGSRSLPLSDAASDVGGSSLAAMDNLAAVAENASKGTSVTSTSSSTQRGDLMPTFVSPFAAQRTVLSSASPEGGAFSGKLGTRMDSGDGSNSGHSSLDTDEKPRRSAMPAFVSPFAARCRPAGSGNSSNGTQQAAAPPQQRLVSPFASRVATPGIDDGSGVPSISELAPHSALVAGAAEPTSAAALAASQAGERASSVPSPASRQGSLSGSVASSANLAAGSSVSRNSSLQPSRNASLLGRNTSLPDSRANSLTSGRNGNLPCGVASPPVSRNSSLTQRRSGSLLGQGVSPPASRNNSLTAGRSGSLANRDGSPTQSRKGSLTTGGEVETWLILEYCDRGTLRGAIDKGWFRMPRATKNGVPQMSIILSVAANIASAMAYLHATGVVHGDLSSHNVLLTSCDTSPHGFTAKIADFGLAKAVALQARITTDTYGTVTHMPPELLRDGHLSQAADVFSVGVLLWEMYCGCRAWAGLSAPQVLTAVAVQGKRPVFPAGTPREYEVLANACMAERPESRPTFAELESAINRLLLCCDEQPVVLGRPSQSRPLPRPSGSLRSNTAPVGSATRARDPVWC